MKNLHLPDEIINAVKEGKFHIYAVSTIDEGIELLTGVPAGKKNANGKKKTSSCVIATACTQINYLVYEKLKKYYENGKEK